MSETVLEAPAKMGSVRPRVLILHDDVGTDAVPSPGTDLGTPVMMGSMVPRVLVVDENVDAQGDQDWIN